MGCALARALFGPIGHDDGPALAIDALRATLTHVGGSVIVERQPAGWGISPRNAPSASFALIREARRALDRDGRLNHRRFTSGI